MNVLSLFSGIGGIDLGLERAGMRIVAQCEIDPFCRAVLAKHWPDIPRFDDVRELHAESLPRVDLIAGGFPCQDVSAAGKGAGIGGARSGLWKEMARLIAECRPAWVLVENVPALRTRGADRVLADLEAIGYDAWPMVVGAHHVGAPHRRNRVWIVANSASLRELQPEGRKQSERRRPSDLRADVPNNDRTGLPDVEGRSGPTESTGRPIFDSDLSSDTDSDQAGRTPIPRSERRQWLIEPDVGRVAHGVPNRVDRLRALGNAVVPQVVEAIGRAIVNEAIR